MNYILFDTYRRNFLLPLTFVRPCCDMRFGILTIREKWEHYLNSETSTLTEDYLQKKFQLKKEKDNILINGTLCPNKDLVDAIKKLKDNQALVSQGIVLALRLSDLEIDKVYAEANEVEEVETDISFVQSLYYKINSQKSFHAQNQDPAS